MNCNFILQTPEAKGSLVISGHLTTRLEVHKSDFDWGEFGSLAVLDKTQIHFFLKNHILSFFFVAAFSDPP